MLKFSSSAKCCVLFILVYIFNIQSFFYVVCSINSNNLRVSKMVASKKTKFSKNRRKGWRKVNIDEIDEFYEDVRLKERVGQPLDEPDFKIDKEAAIIKPALEKVKKLKKLKTTKDLSKNIKAFKSLVPSSKVEPMVVFKTSPQEQKIKPKVYGKSIKKKRENWMDVKVFDIWGNDTRKKPERTTRLKVTSLLPPVELPHPGTSINPAIEDHQDLLKQASDIELKKLKKEQHFNRVLNSGVKKKTATQIQKQWLEEMSAGLPINAEKEDENDEDDKMTDTEDADLISKKKVVRAEDAKSKSKRRREMLIKMQKQAKEKEKERKMEENKVFQLKRLKKEIAAQEEKAKAKSEIYKKKFVEKRFKPARLGPHKYEEPDIPINLPEELAPRLRQVKTEGDLFEDRLKSLQKRNIIEPRKLILKVQKKNVKWTEKRDCRDQQSEIDLLTK